MIAVFKESPTLSIISSIVLMLAVLCASTTDRALTWWFLVSPLIFIAILAMLFIVYASIIWSSEFETPPEVIEEYRWYLNRLQTQLLFAQEAKKVQFQLESDEDTPGPSRRSTNRVGFVADAAQRNRSESEVEVHEYLLGDYDQF